MKNIDALLKSFETTRAELNEMGEIYSLSSVEMLQKSKELDDIHNELQRAQNGKGRLLEQSTEEQGVKIDDPTPFHYTRNGE